MSQGLVKASMLFVTVAVFVLAAEPSHAVKWWKKDFCGEGVNFGVEDNGTGSWGDYISHCRNPHNSWHFGIVKKKKKHPVRYGKESLRFKVKPGDCGDEDCKTGRERSEVEMSSRDLHGRAYWYAWSVYFKNYKTIKNIAVHHGQWKQYNTGLMYPTFSKMSRGLYIEFGKDYGKYKKYLIIPNKEFRNKWHDLRVQVKWSTRSNGFFKLWRNGKLLVNRKGRNVKSKDPLSFRFGIYRPFENRPKSNITQTVYYDELLRGKSCNAVSQFMICPGSRTKKTKVKFRQLPLKDWNLSYIGTEIHHLANQLVNNNRLMSFKGIKMADLYAIGESNAIGLGFRAGGNSQPMRDIVYRFMFGDSSLTFMTDDSLLGIRPRGSLQIVDASSHYINIGNKAKFRQWDIATNLSWAHADGRGGGGSVRGVEEIDAIGLNVHANYNWDKRHSMLFSIAQPMRIESGALEFDQFTGDLTPEGRQIDLTLSYKHQLSVDQSVVAKIRYARDYQHYSGARDAGVMLAYSGRF